MDTNKYLTVTTNMQRMMQQGIIARLGYTNKDISNTIQAYMKQYDDALKQGETHASIIRAFYRTMRDVYRKDIDGRIKDLIACKKGCAFCCHINVDATPGEVDMIIEYTRANNIPIDYNRLWRQRGLSMKQRPQSQYSACVFLAEDNTCKIYEVKPIGCRKYFVFNDPKECDAKTNNEDRVKIYADFHLEAIASAIFNMQQPASMVELLLRTVNPNLKHV